MQLRQMGLVSDRREGVWVYYSMAPALTKAHAAVLDCLKTCFHEDSVLSQDLESYRTQKQAQALACCGPQNLDRQPKTVGSPRRKRQITMSGDKKNILFICVENSNRSQMAEAFARLHGDDIVEAYSSGSRPSGRINPKAIAAMKDKGIDLATHRSKALEDLPCVEWEHVVTMGCGDECPHLPAKHRDDWALPDPRNMNPDDFNQVRDEIERRVLELLTTIRKDQVMPDSVKGLEA